MKILIFGFLSLFFTISSPASSELLAHSILIDRESDFQKYIDQSFTNILSKDHNKELICSLFTNYIDLYYSLGLSASAAQNLYQHCPQKQTFTLGKTIQKSYYLSNSHQLFESWTDQANRTFIFFDRDSTFADLQTRLLHEMAISYDAKTQMFYTGYLIYEVAAKNQRIISIGNLTEQEKTLQHAFNQSHWLPVTRSFSTMRAFMFEHLLIQGQLSHLSHDQCVAEFKKIFPMIKKIPDYSPSSAIDVLVSQVSQVTHRNFTPRDQQHEEEILNFLLDSRLTLKNRQGKTLSFCQYMSYPLLTSRSLYNSFSHGPRPRVTGGSGGQGGSGETKESRLYSPSFSTDALQSDENFQFRRELQRLRSSMPAGSVLPEDERQQVPAQNWENIFKN